jgi:surface polysaccharide O-acyltransferase-like enzyme
MDNADRRNQRSAGIDLVKIIACFLVVTLHTCFTGNGEVTYSSILYYSGVVAMPLFFIVHGYLLFGKTKINPFYIYIKRDKICGLVFFVNMLWCVLWFVYQKKLINPFSETINELFFQGGSFGQFWFFGSLIIIYILFPHIDKLFINNRKRFFYLAVLLVMTQIIADGTNIFMALSGRQLLSQRIPQTFRLETHLSYFLIGGVLQTTKDKISKYVNIVVLLVMYTAVMIYQFYMIKNIYPTYYCEYFYDNILVILFSTAVFVFFTKIRFVEIKIVEIVAGTIMVVYIIHPKLLSVSGQYIQEPIIKLITVIILSVVIGVMVKKIPIVNKIFKL